MDTWAVPSPALGAAWTHPRCANGNCTYGIPASDPSINTIAGITESGLTAANFIVADTSQTDVLNFGASIVAVGWADFDNDGAWGARRPRSPVPPLCRTRHAVLRPSAIALANPSCRLAGFVCGEPCRHRHGQ